MTDKEIIRTSKFLSLILRHEPERVGLKLNDAGWVGVAELLNAVNQQGVSLTLDQLKHIVNIFSLRVREFESLGVGEVS